MMQSKTVKLVLLRSLCLMATFGLFVWWLSAEGFRFNTTPSLPRGIYKLAQGTPSTGDLVSFCLRGPQTNDALAREYLTRGSCPSGVQPLLKLVAALPGDSIVQSTEGIWVNNELWPHSKVKQFDRFGRPLMAAALPSFVPPGMALILSNQHDGSFDSRYIGLVPFDDLQKVSKILTF